MICTCRFGTDCVRYQSDSGHSQSEITPISASAIKTKIPPRWIRSRLAEQFQNRFIRPGLDWLLGVFSPLEKCVGIFVSGNLTILPLPLGFDEITAEVFHCLCKRMALEKHRRLCKGEKDLFLERLIRSSQVVSSGK